MLFAVGVIAGLIVGAAIVVWVIKGAFADAIGRGMNW